MPNLRVGSNCLDWGSWSEADRLRRLSWRPGLLVNFMALSPGDAECANRIHNSSSSVSNQRGDSPANRPETTGSAGTLVARLAPELVDMILGELDLQTLCCGLSLASRHSRDLVRSLRSYRDLTAHAAPALVTLARCGLLSHHPVSRLHAALRRTECTECCPRHGGSGSFAPFLFLPTATRCCLECANKNPALWVVELPEAERFFAVPASCLALAGVPFMKKLPDGFVSVVPDGPPSRAGRHPPPPSLLPSRPGPSRRREGKQNTPEKEKQQLLVSLRQAKEAAMRIYGSQENVVCAAQPAVKPAERARFDFLVGVALEPLGVEPCFLPADGDRLSGEAMDRFSGAGVTFFPSLIHGGGGHDGVPERGVWCLGCRYLAVTAEGEGAEEHLLRGLRGLERRAYTRAGFLEHVCTGLLTLPKGFHSWRRRVAVYEVE